MACERLPPEAPLSVAAPSGSAHHVPAMPLAQIGRIWELVAVKVKGKGVRRGAFEMHVAMLAHRRRSMPIRLGLSSLAGSVQSAPY